MMNHKSGYAAIIGLPNAGKSTLMNNLLGQKISIITSKPQTTRKNILGILSENDYQIIFLDTPGILKPNYLLQEKMMDFVGQSVKDADVIIFIVDLGNDLEGKKLFKEEFAGNVLIKNKKPKILLLNKIDLTNQEATSTLIKKYEAEGNFSKVIPISASQNFNLIEVKNSIVELLPEGPTYYPEDIVADENERFFVSEIIREKVLEQYQEEIPYSVEIVINEFKERDDKKNFIRAEIIVERESQKGIIIGKQGTAIKKLGEKSREAIEEFLQHPVFLELRVKVGNKWRSDEKQLKSFGYSKDKQ